MGAANRVDSADRRAQLLAPFELDRIVIEADPIRRSLADALSGPFDAPAPRGIRTSDTAEGRCSCFNRCPPPPLPCCSCSAYPSNYLRSPGMAPLR